MKGIDVGVDVHRGDTRIARAGDGLQRGDHDSLMPNCFSGAERQRQHDGGAVRIGDDLPLPAARPLLPRDDLQVIGIDLGNQQRHIGLHAVVARVRDDDVAGCGERPLDFGGDRCIHRGEHEARRIAGLRTLDVRSATSSGMAPSSRQRRRVAVLLAGGAIARADPRQLEPRMVLQKLDEMLADHSGRAENTYFNWFA